MRYAPPGMCLNDFDLQRVGDEWRVLHLQAPPIHPFDSSVLETSYGHARSHDLVTWEPLGPPFGIGHHGSFDDSAVWTMHQIPRPLNEGAALFYTGVSLRPYPHQSIGLALSDSHDGTGWIRHGTGPVVEADSSFYRTDEHMAWRDPFVVFDELRNEYVMVVCARTRHQPLERSGCVGLASSTDLLNWHVQPPLLVPGDVDEFECPVLERVEDGWLLLGSIGADHSLYAWHAPDLRGPWSARGRVGPAGIYAPRLTDAGGQRLLLHTLQRSHGDSDEGPAVRGVLAQPKAFVYQPGEAPRLTWWQGLIQHFEHTADELDGDGMLTTVLPAAAEDVRLTVRDSGHRSLLLTLESDRLALAYSDGTPVEEVPLGGTVAGTLRVLLLGAYIEVYLDNELRLSTRAYEATGTASSLTVDGVRHPLRRHKLRPVSQLRQTPPSGPGTRGQYRSSAVSGSRHTPPGLVIPMFQAGR
ncbi:mucin-1 [Streptomyces rubiginosohelvolus]|uniref:mucin-1 n=1 Tax=Streptomyces rubiginosohelvolus TaxID=67362 RepID=UPI003690A581